MMMMSRLPASASAFALLGTGASAQTLPAPSYSAVTIGGSKITGVGTAAGTVAAGNTACDITGATDCSGAKVTATGEPQGWPLSVRFAERVDVARYILPSDTDATSSINRAVAYALSKGVPTQLYFPCGTYTISGAILISTSAQQGVLLQGEASSCVTIRQTADADAFDITLTNYGGAMSTGAVKVAGLKIAMVASASTTRNGLFISSTASSGVFGVPVIVDDDSFSSVSPNAYWGTELNISQIPNGVYLSHLNGIYTGQTAGSRTGTHLSINGNATSYTTSVFVRDVFFNGGQYGVVLGNYLQGIHLDNINTVGTRYALYAAPTAGIGLEFQIANSYLDGLTYIGASSPATISAVDLHDTYFDQYNVVSGDTHVIIANVNILALSDNIYNGSTAANVTGLSLTGSAMVPASVIGQKFQNYSGSGSVPMSVAVTNYPILFDANEFINNGSNLPKDTSTTGSFRNFYTNTRINGTAYTYGGINNGTQIFGGPLGSNLLYDFTTGPDSVIGRIWIVKGMPTIDYRFQDGNSRSILQLNDSQDTTTGNPVIVKGGATGASPQVIAAATTDLALGATGAQPTSATTGLVQIPYMAGTPTGTPATTGGATMVFDTVNVKLWVYSPSASKWAVAGTPQSVGGISATGTTQATATALTADVNAVTTVASGSGALLSGISRQEVFNRGANALLVYPPSGAAIESGSANAAVSLAVGSHAVFECVSATQCYQAP